MPAEYRIVPSERTIYSRAWGILTDRDLAENRARMLRDPDFDPGCRQLLDFSEVTSLEVTPGGIRELAGTSPFPRDARRAVVVPNDVAYGMARMFALLSGLDESRFRIFRDRAVALEWLTQHHP